MKNEKWQAAFEPADEAYVEKVEQELARLNAGAGREQHARSGKTMGRIGVLAALVLSVGILLAQGSILRGVNQDPQNPAAAMATGLPQENPEAVFEAGTIRVEQVETDGFGIYLTLSLIPKEADTLILSPGLKLFYDRPEKIGQVSDFSGQSIAKWAVAHGYSRIYTANFHSQFYYPELIREDLTEEEYSEQLKNSSHVLWNEENNSGILDQLSKGAGIGLGGFTEDPGTLREDGTMVIHLYGGVIPGDTSYPVVCAIVPVEMTAEGTKPGAQKNDQESSGDVPRSTALITITMPETGAENPEILAQYTGFYEKTAGKEVTVTVRLLRTSRSDYTEVICPDLNRNFSLPTLYETKDGFSTTFGYTEPLFMMAAQEGDHLIYRRISAFDGKFPEKMYISWSDSANSARNEYTHITRTETDE